MSVHVTSLPIYPLKSGRGIFVDTMQVAAKGPIGDREWVVVDAANNNRFLSQRTHPHHFATLTADNSVLGSLHLSASGHSDIVIAQPNTREAMVTMWKENSPAFDAGDEAALWLEEFLKDKRVTPRLMYQGPSHFRPSDPGESQPDDPVSFADGFPYLLTTEDSLKEVNARASAPTPIGQFRSNVVASGALPFAEDYFCKIKIGTVPFDVVKACGRCHVTLHDQRTGEFSPGKGEPLATLKEFREGYKGKTYFGVYMIPRSLGEIHLGDEVSVLERHPFPLPQKGMTW